MRKWLALSILLTASPVFAQPALPAAVCKTINTVRGSGPIVSKAQLGTMLNLIAWTHRDEDFGLSRKDAGNNCQSPVGNVACDILQLPPSRGGWMFDVFGSADVGEPTVPSCGRSIGSSTDPARIWVAPADPGATIPPPPPIEAATRAELAAAIMKLHAELWSEVSHELAELRSVMDRGFADANARIDAHPIVDSQALASAIDAALLNYEVNGKTRTSFGHQHAVQFGITKRK